MNAVRRPGTLQAITLLLPVTMTIMGIVVLLPVMPALFARFAGVPHVDIWVPVMLTTPAVMVVLCAGAAGLAADITGRRRLLLLSMVLYAAFGTAPFFMQDFFAIFATRVAVGACEAAVLVVSTTMISDYFTGAARDRWLAWQTGVAAVAATVLVVAGGALGSLFGWRGPFLIYSMALPLALLVLLFTWEPVADAASIAQGRASWAGFDWRRMGGICAITIVAAYVFYLVQIQISPALSMFGLVDPARAGQLLAFVSTGIILGSFLFRYVAAVKVSTLLCAEFLLIGAGLVAMSGAGSTRSLIVFAWVSQIGAGLVLPTLLTWAVRGLAFTHRGRGAGLWQSTFSLGQFLVSISVPAINKATGGLFASFGVIGWVALGMAGLMGMQASGSFLKERTKKLLSL